MNSWYVLDLGDAMLADKALNAIKTLFLTEYAKAENPQEMALFVRHETARHLHCTLKLYFSPAAGKIAETAAALPCKQPAPDGLSLLAGDAGGADLFPKEGR